MRLVETVCEAGEVRKREDDLGIFVYVHVSSYWCLNGVVYINTHTHTHTHTHRLTWLLDNLTVEVFVKLQIL